MIVVGGYDENFNILTDYWLLQKSFDDYGNQEYNWKVLIPNTNSIIPPPITETCIILDFPYFYYIGGRTGDGLTNELWKFDIQNQNFTRFNIQGLKNISRHGCSLTYINNNKFILKLHFFSYCVKIGIFRTVT